MNNEVLDNIEEDEIHKYLRFQQNTKINHTDITIHLKAQYKQRLLAILKTPLNSYNLFKAINTFSIPILIYSFVIIKCTRTDLEIFSQDRGSANIENIIKMRVKKELR